MVTRCCGVTKWLVLAVSIICTVLVLGVLPARVQSATLDLPPRPPTPTSTPMPTTQPAPKPGRETEPRGAFIELHVQSTTGEFASNWQGLWTVVQWQDAQGRWHDVEGWRGALDMMQDGAGRKTWWLAASLFGQGPFRWLVAPVKGDSSLTISESFYLPRTAEETIRVEVLLTP